mgnify:CR=1 FL=1
MTLLPPNVKVHLALGFIDMRKGIDGLAMLVQGVLHRAQRRLGVVATVQVVAGAHLQDDALEGHATAPPGCRGARWRSNWR